MPQDTKSQPDTKSQQLRYPATARSGTRDTKSQQLRYPATARSRTRDTKSQQLRYPATARSGTPDTRTRDTSIIESQKNTRAALVAELDRLYRTGALLLGLARSSVVDAPDPIGEAVY